MAWIAEPLTFYGLLATGLVLCLFLFVSLKKENTNLRKILEQDRRMTIGKMEEFRSSMLRLQGALELASAEDRTQVGAPNPETRSSIGQCRQEKLGPPHAQAWRNTRSNLGDAPYSRKRGGLVAQGPPRSYRTSLRGQSRCIVTRWPRPGIFSDSSSNVRGNDISRFSRISTTESVFFDALSRGPDGGGDVLG